MTRELLLCCLPYVAMMVAALGVLRLLVWANNVQVDWRRLLSLHRDQRGGVQSLSFVLTLPIFAMIVMFIVQLSQLMIGRAMVEYAAFAAARSASVWIPANLGPDSGEMENQISSLSFLREEVGPDGQTYSVYEVSPGSPKFNKVHYAAAMACLPICPSRDTGVSRAHPGNTGLASLIRAYGAAAPSTVSNTRVPYRLEHKLAYALANTNVRIEIWHKEAEPPLARWEVLPYWNEFRPNEIGWQDQIHVTVRHNFALLPGPGRLLARRTDGPADAPPVADDGTSSGDTSAQNVQYQIASGQGDQTSQPVDTGRDRTADRIRRLGTTYVYTLSSTVRLSNEGEKPVLPYVQSLDGTPPRSVPLDFDRPPGGDQDQGDGDQNNAPQQRSLPPCEDCEPDARDTGGVG